MAKNYKITNLPHLLKDEASVKFHVKSDDYFGTIATIINLLRQEFEKNDRNHTAVLNKLLKNLEKDLLILQKDYQIKARFKNKNKTPKGKLKDQ